MIHVALHVMAQARGHMYFIELPSLNESKCEVFFIFSGNDKSDLAKVRLEARYSKTEITLDPDEEIEHENGTCYVITRDCTDASDRFRFHLDT